MVSPKRIVVGDLYPCEWPGCSQRGVAEINAQWTIVDYVAYVTCQKHAADMWDHLRKKRVDDQLPADMWFEAFTLAADEDL